MNLTMLGLDLSYGGTGVCVLRDGKHHDLRTLKHPKKMAGPERLEWFKTAIGQIYDDERPYCVAVEGYAFGATSQAHKIGELGGLIKHNLWMMGAQLLIVPPTTLKKFCTGKGSGPKGMVMVAAFKRWGVEAADDDQADAAVLAHIALANSYDRASDDLTIPQRESLSKIESIPPRVIARTRTRAA
jgi:crossover junction endodeoxyribonuclease RuvC